MGVLDRYEKALNAGVDQFGGQLIPPDDQNLVDEVTQNVSDIKTVAFEQAKTQGLITIIGDEIPGFCSIRGLCRCRGKADSRPGRRSV